jgi:hypothetical protein
MFARLDFNLSALSESRAERLSYAVLDGFAAATRKRSYPPTGPAGIDDLPPREEQQRKLEQGKQHDAQNWQGHHQFHRENSPSMVPF